MRKNYLLFERQCGFRNKLSTNHYARAIYLDFKKAFDTVNHNTLLDKLAHSGVIEIENNWFKTYLTNKIFYPKKIRHFTPKHLSKTLYFSLLTQI